MIDVLSSGNTCATTSGALVAYVTSSACALGVNVVVTPTAADLERELPITLAEALLGGEVPVTTLKGRVLLRIPPGTQNGHRFRLKGQGMPRLRGEGNGDLYAKARVVLPPKLDEEAAEAARAFFEKLDQPDPRAVS